jgi:hypothetical protein
MIAASGERQSRSARWESSWAWIGAAALALALIVHRTLAAGTWLDEYWQLWISAAPSDALYDRLVADAHPPWFNLFARPLLVLTREAIMPARIIDLLAATAVLGAGLWSMRSLDAPVRWRIFLLIVASAGEAGMIEATASFRVYPWLIALAALQSAILLATVEGRPVPPILAALVTAASISLHYVHAAGAIAIALVTLAIPYWRQRIVARPVLIGLAVGVVLDVATGLWHLPQWRRNVDVNWIAEAGGGALYSFWTVALSLLIFNLIAIILIALRLVRGTHTRILLLLAPLPIAIAAWLALDAVTPMLVPRYLGTVTAIVAVAAAAAWRDLEPRPAASAGIALLIALQPLASEWLRLPRPGWESGAHIVAGIRRGCPDAPVFAINPWRFRDHPESQAARFESPVNGFAYARVARGFGFQPQYVTGPTKVPLGRCPAIVWMEARKDIEQVSPERVLRLAQLEVPEGVRTRFIPTYNGAVLVIARADQTIPIFEQSALEPRP